MNNSSSYKIENDGKTAEQNKVISLFQFISEMNKLKQKSVLNYKDYPWYYNLSDIPDDPENIHIYYRDRSDEVLNTENDMDEDILLSVHKPKFQKCPKPDASFASWLSYGWDDFRKEVSRKEYITLNEENANSEEIIYFDDDQQRVIAYKLWIKKRTEWVQRQFIIEKTRDFFSELYRLYFELQRESEIKEIVAANGIIYDKENASIQHPVLTHRVAIDYDADENVVYIKDTSAPSELYSIVFQMMKEINHAEIGTINKELEENDYHPLDRNDTPGFLKVLVHQLSASSAYFDKNLPRNWEDNNRIAMHWCPCYIVRKRLDGTVKAIEQIIENVQETGEIPAHIADIVSGGTIEIPEDSSEISIEEQLAAVGGESVDILLSKEANREQLEIARRIELYNAVLVQGPPGTGKTHTIANLMGHFLAQGKSVLVTSHTTKALSVLKEKIVPGLQDLCVSILDDSNLDMERSIDGITSYMAKTTSHELKNEMNALAIVRQDIINQLASVRRKIFETVNQECNCIVYNGEDISPSKAAEFVAEHAQDLSYIPGKVRLHTPMPLSFEQLSTLYRSNEKISEKDESELQTNLPNPIEVMAPSEFQIALESEQIFLAQAEKVASTQNITFDRKVGTQQICLRGTFGEFTIKYPDAASVQSLRDYVSSFGKIEKWMKAAAVDGRKGGNFRQRWITLIEQIKKTNYIAEKVVGEQFGLHIQFTEPERIREQREVFESMRSAFSEKGKIGKLAMMMHKEYGIALNAVTINGNQVQSVQDCDIILHYIELDENRKKCEAYWNELLAIYGAPAFSDLASENQESIALNWISEIQKYLGWYQNAYKKLTDMLRKVEIPEDAIFEMNVLDSDVVITDKVLSAVENTIPAICDICAAVIKADEYSEKIRNLQEVLIKGECGKSRICSEMLSAIANCDVRAYAEAFAVLENTFQKYSLQCKRSELLKILESVAPQWAEEIRNRKGIHGQFTVPENIEEAWKWKQLCGIVDEITEKPFSELQLKSIRLSKTYREITAQYAEKCGWYHLLHKTEANIDMKQALQGWKLTVKKIGKGTGKQAPMLKAKARALMTKCQSAVPGWIMPINRALESLNPKYNRFDIIIIDEASQSDVSSLAILYMGKKLIIVGDDKQVSPMAVGVEIDKMSALEQMYIKDKIPNAHLYNAKTSIYDIATTTFQPLMLREHFRCVPEIIGFSNMLSYDYKIKPLRDASSSTLLPAVVNFRVHGEREGKINREEAKTIIALIKACIEQPEYKDKSIGVISLMGDEQVKLISGLIEQEIDPKEVKHRRIICGNSANFQGDERDVIFLSLVDSSNGEGPLQQRTFGIDDSLRKRYNVATSRARDQLWVVDSLDPYNDLKQGDIRKILIDYSVNPSAYEIRHEEAEERADSPFEAAVATSLINQGYHIVQQWNVGAYRLDIVVVYKNKKIAIECDGERWHSGEAKIREDMERQTILERLGWRFIRIRGSEYYRNPEKTIARVISELTDCGIEPEAASDIVDSKTRDTELLDRVKSCAAIILSEKTDELYVSNERTIAAALNPRSLVPDNVPRDAAITSAVADTSKEHTVQKQAEKNEQLSFYIKNSEEPLTQTVNELKKITIQSEKNKMKADTAGDSQQIQMKIDEYADNDLKESIIELLDANKITYIDKRKVKGALWIIGGEELRPVVAKAKSLGFNFKFKAGGGKQTKGKDAWWTK